MTLFFLAPAGKWVKYKKMAEMQSAGTQMTDEIYVCVCVHAHVCMYVYMCESWRTVIIPQKSQGCWLSMQFFRINMF